MSFATKRRMILNATIAIVVASALLLAFALQRLVRTETELATGSGESLLYALFQAHDEEQRLILEAYDWKRNAGAAADAEELRVQMDLALSRLDVVSQGTLGLAVVAAGEQPVISSVHANLTAFDEVVQTAIRQGTVIPQPQLELLRDDVSRLKAATTRVMIAERENVWKQRDRYSSVLGEAIVAVLLIIGCGVFIVARLMGSLRSAANAERALRRDRDFSRLLLESSGDGVLAIDTAFRCTHWNTAMGKMFPVPTEAEVVGRLLQDAYLLPDDHIIMDMMRKTLAGESLRMPAHPIPTGNLYVEKYTYPVMSRAKVVGAILFIRDVTEAHLARLELVEHRDQLETIVADRTRDLEESLARETRLREHYKGFVTMVSHQFRTPLSIIDASAQRIIRRGKQMTEAEIHERAGKIRSAVLRLTRLVSSTLNATKIDAGQIDVEIRRCDIGKLIVEACDRQKETSPDRVFRLELDDLPEWVPCDPLLIDQVLANLLSNAVKYSPAPHAIDIATEMDPDRVRVKVSDRGIGVLDDERDRLFERFFRAKAAVGVEGTGIGLHVARTIARMHGGEVEAFNRVGGGSTFVLSIPKQEKLAA